MSAEKEKRSGKFFSLKSTLPKSLLGRSLLILILPVLLIQAVVTFVFFDNHWHKVTGRLAYAVAGEVAVMAMVIENADSSETIERMSGHAAQNLNLLISFVRDEKLGEADIKSSGRFWEQIATRALTEELESRVRRPYRLDVDFEDKWVRISVQLSNGVLHVSLPERRVFSSSSYIFLLWMLGASIVFMVIAVLFMRNQIKPIRRLAIAAERFGKGREVPNFKLEGAREVRLAGQAFLEMHRRIRRQVSQRTTMLAGVSHDLRTPLTRMKLQLEMMGDTPDIRAMKDDIHDMEKMVQGYLDFVRGEGEEQATITCLNALLQKIVDTGVRGGGRIMLEAPEEINLTIRPLAFGRAIGNLVHNALAHGQRVWVSLKRVKQDRVEIRVEDNGPGIPEEMFEDVFRPFFRGDSARHAEGGSVGLGLPIAMDIVHSHGGKIWLEKSAHGGLAAVVRLPG